MVPSAETCEACHWKQQPAAARVKLIQRYAEDEANTPETTLLTMNVGGERMGGIHGAHHGEGIEIRFVATDPNRQDIPLVEYRNTKTGVNRTYVKAGVDAAALADARAAHPHAVLRLPQPRRARVRDARPRGRPGAHAGPHATSLPFLKKTAVEILQAEYASSDGGGGRSRGPGRTTSASSPRPPRTRAADIDEAGQVLADIYSRNVFPELGVTWGTYPDNRGHQDTAPGCFRCHDGEHITASGEAITNNCFRCHFPSPRSTRPIPRCSSSWASIGC